MWRVALQDLLFRRRRFAIAIIATSLVFAMTLLTSGAGEGTHHEDRQIIDLFEADSWYVSVGGSGPFTSSTPVSVSVADEVAQLSGVTRASPVLLFRSTAALDERRDVNIVGIPPGGLGMPPAAEGRVFERSGEVVADAALGVAVGEMINVGGTLARVVGTADDVTYFFGTPTVFMPIGDVQAQFFGFVPAATAVVAQGGDGDVPGLKRMTPDDVDDDLRRLSERSDQTIQFLNVLLWIVAIGIVGSIIYMTALDRVRDFAVMKAVGASTGALLAGLLMQSIVLSGASAILAMGIAHVLAPGFPFTVRITGSSVVLLVLSALVIGVVASAAGLRRAVAVDPALAFGGS